MKNECTKLEQILSNAQDNNQDLASLNSRLTQVVIKLAGQDKEKPQGVRQGCFTEDGFISALESVNFNTTQESKELSDLIGILEELI